MHHTALITEASPGPGAEFAARSAAPAGRGVREIPGTPGTVPGAPAASPERAA